MTNSIISFKKEDVMTTNDLLKLHEHVVDSWSQHDAKKWLTIMDDNIVFYDTGYPEPIRGKAALEKYFNAWIAAFPDFKMKSLNAVVAGNDIAAEIEGSGTNTGSLITGNQPEIPATNRKMTSRFSYFAKVNNGKVSEVHVYTDVAGMITQLGLQPVHEMHA